MQQKELETFYPSSRQKWREWLKKNHRIKQSVWLVCYKKKTNVPTISWSDAVDEALCFGWIDSTRRSLDADTFIQFFARRKAGSMWSKVNKAKVEQLISDKRMTKAGLESIKVAKQNGSWIILDEVETGVIPNDLSKAFKAHKGSKEFFQSLSNSVRKMILVWLVLAKREETRKKRIDEIAELAGMKLRPKQFR